MKGPLISRITAQGMLALVILTTSTAAGAQNNAPVVSNVVAQQIVGTGNVRVTFDVTDADGDSVYIKLFISSDNGTNFDLVPTTVTGDVNMNIMPGTGKQIIWNAFADYPGRYWPQVVAKVFASDGGSLGGVMVAIPRTTFNMGGNSPPGDNQIHAVTIDSLMIDKFEVTNAEYKVFIDAGGYSVEEYWSPAEWSWKLANAITAPLYWAAGTNNSGPGYPGFPVTGISWYEAEAYASFVNKRLPTEAEWELAARGTNGWEFPFGNAIDFTRANYSGTGALFSLTSPVGFYDGRTNPSPPFQTTNSPGAFGSYDQCGNVQEWVNDWYSNSYYSVSPTINPPGPISGSDKVTRGGSWFEQVVDISSPLRSYGRRHQVPGTRDNKTGFRCARSL